MLTGAEVTVTPLPSVATALRMYFPARTFDQVKQGKKPAVGGGLVPDKALFTVPRLVLPAKNCTDAMLPPRSPAAAQTWMSVLAKNIAPFPGLANLTCGGKFVGTGG